MASYGLTPQGFVSKSHSELRAEARTLAQQLLGNQLLDLSSTSVITQLLDIYTNGLADCWAAASDLYASAYPNGATGLQVDQLLAVNNLARLPAVATVTDPTPITDAGGNPSYGFVVLGTPGAVLPAGTLVSTGQGSAVQFATDADIAVAAGTNARQALLFSNTPTAGAFALALTAPDGTQYTTASMPYSADPNGTRLTFATYQGIRSYWNVTVNGDSNYQFILGTNVESNVLQSYLQSVPGYEGTTVTGTRSTGWLINWASKSATLTFSGAGSPNGIYPSIQETVRGIQAADKSAPFGDVKVSASGQSLIFEFGAVTLPVNSPTTAAQPIGLIAVASSTLTRGTFATNLSPRHQVFGAPARGVGSATCTQSGANEVVAGQLSTLLSPAPGITSVNNPLDCIAGRDLESDADAMLRLQQQQSAAATGSLAAIVARVQATAGVTQAVGFQNATSASQQLLVFSDTPTTGTFALALAGTATAALPYNAAPAALQAALRQIAGLDDVIVAGAGQSGYQIDFGPISGSQPHALFEVPTNTTGVGLTVYTGCPSHAVEIIAEGGTPANIGQAILSALPAGIATYGRASLRLPGSITASSASVAMTTTAGIEAGQTVTAAELPEASVVQLIDTQGITLNRVASATNASAALAFGYGASLSDASGNAVFVRFSRPKAVLVYVDLTLHTDQALGVTSQFNEASVAAIQSTLLATVNAVPIGGTVVTTGTKGLLNSFRSVPGIQAAEIAIGRTASPTSNAPLVMASNETPVAESTSVNITVL